MVTEVCADIGTVVTEKVAVVFPEETVTDAGTVATAVLLLVRVTVTPAEEAGPFSVTVPVELVPPPTLVGLRVSVLKAGGITVRVAVLVTPPLLAVMVTAVDAATGVVVMGNVALELPAAIVTEA